MKRFTFAVVFSIAITLVIDYPASAGVFARLFRPRHHATYPIAPTYRYYPFNYQNDYRSIYPKYYGGFHARYFDNYGVPSGDIGPRGNGIYVTPW